MIKQDIVDNVASATGLTKVEVEAVLNESFSEIIKALSSNDKIELRGFGTFSVKHRLPKNCLLYTSPSPRDGLLSRMPSSA